MISSKETDLGQKKLALFAKNISDLNVISALSQDAVLKKQNIRWFKKRHRFSMLINRFRWELVPNKFQATVPFSRLHSMLAFEGALKVSSFGVEHALEDEILSLLRIEMIKKGINQEIELVFAGNILVRIEVEFIRVYLQDLGVVHSPKKGLVPKHEL